MATYGPGIDQSQHAKSVSHIIKYNTVSRERNTFSLLRYIKFYLDKSTIH